MSNSHVDTHKKKHLLPAIILIINICVVLFLVMLFYKIDSQKQMIINHDKVIQKLEGAIDKFNKNYDNKRYTQSKDRKFKNKRYKKRIFDFNKEFAQLDNLWDDTSNFISKLFDFSDSEYSLSFSSINSDHFISNTETHLEIKIDLQGFNKEDIKVKIKNKILLVNADKNSNIDNKKITDKDNKNIKINKDQRFFSFSLAGYEPHLIKNDIKSDFENGTLIIIIPKSKEQNSTQDNEFEIKIN